MRLKLSGVYCIHIKNNQVLWTVFGIDIDCYSLQNGKLRRHFAVFKQLKSANSNSSLLPVAGQKLVVPLI